MYQSTKTQDTTILNTKPCNGMIAGAHTRPSGQSQRITTTFQTKQNNNSVTFEHLEIVKPTISLTTHQRKC